VERFHLPILHIHPDNLNACRGCCLKCTQPEDACVCQTAVLRLLLHPQCLPDAPTNEPATPEDDNTGDTTGDEDEPEEVNEVPSPQTPVSVPSSSPAAPEPNPTQIKNDLTCTACGQRPKATAMALSQAIASSGGDCNSPAGQALAQAFASASASGQGAAFAQSIASAQAVSAQKVSLVDSLSQLCHSKVEP
jgi:outer membrane biosynthesis protein TonB